MEVDEEVEQRRQPVEVRSLSLAPSLSLLHDRVCVEVEEEVEQRREPVEVRHREGQLVPRHPRQQLLPALPLTLSPSLSPSR